MKDTLDQDFRTNYDERRCQGASLTINDPLVCVTETMRKYKDGNFLGVASTYSKKD